MCGCIRRIFCAHCGMRWSPDCCTGHGFEMPSGELGHRLPRISLTSARIKRSLQNPISLKILTDIYINPHRYIITTAGILSYRSRREFRRSNDFETDIRVSQREEVSEAGSDTHGAWESRSCHQLCLRAQAGRRQQSGLGDCLSPPPGLNKMVDERRALRLSVRGCKSEDEGMNLVFMAYSDFRTLASSDGQHDSVRIILQVCPAIACALLQFCGQFSFDCAFYTALLPPTTDVAA